MVVFEFKAFMPLSIYFVMLFTFSSMGSLVQLLLKFSLSM